MPTTPPLKLGLYQILIPFKVKFSHASAERTETSSIWVEAIAADGVTGYGESCPRTYVTGETIQSVNIFFSRYQNEICHEINSLTSMRQWMARHQRQLDDNPAAWCAIELAILDVLAKQKGETMESFLGIPPLEGNYQYSAVLGDADIESFRTNLAQYLYQGFTDFKCKLSGNLTHDQEKTAELNRHNNHRLSIRLDANNLWSSADEAMRYLRALDCPFFAIEEPLKPNLHAELAVIGDTLNCTIILDESLLRIEQLALLNRSLSRWIINLRVSKMGGVLRSLAIVESARHLGIDLIVGAQVGETSLLTRAGLTIAKAGADILNAQEGAFGTYLLERDICVPPLMFGNAGMLNSANYISLNEPGFGFNMPKTPDFMFALL